MFGLIYGVGIIFQALLDVRTFSDVQKTREKDIVQYTHVHLHTQRTHLREAA